MDTYPASMWLRAPNLRAAHGFSLRRGGVSRAPYDSLNFDDRADDPGLVAENRRRALTALGLTSKGAARLDQVHGLDVRRAKVGAQSGDALVTDQPNLPLAIMTADCYPILFEDAQAGVLGAAHAGWRGTAGRIAARTVQAMVALGARPGRISAALGPGICGECYPVGADVARQFEAAGLGEAILTRQGAVHLDLLRANLQVLAEAGVTDVWAVNRCSTESDFFSYRRAQVESGGHTGRMWAVIGRGVGGSSDETLTDSEGLGD